MMENTQGPSPEAVETIKSLRKEIDANINRVEYLMGMQDVPGNTVESTAYEIRSAGARELALVRTKLQEAKMWAGKILEVLGNPFPPELVDKAE